MVDRTMTVPRSKTGAVFGRLDSNTMAIVDAALARFFGLEAAAYDEQRQGKSCLKTTARSMRQGTRSTIEKNGAGKRDN
jgi:hypothetical protein